MESRHLRKKRRRGEVRDAGRHLQWQDGPGDGVADGPVLIPWEVSEEGRQGAEEELAGIS